MYLREKGGVSRLGAQKNEASFIRGTFLATYTCVCYRF
jgi:hypothetical protein